MRTDAEMGRGHYDIPMRLALSTTVEGAISAVVPLIGGVIVYTLGYATLAYVAGVLLSASLLILLAKVREPRRRGLPGD